MTEDVWGTVDGHIARARGAGRPVGESLYFRFADLGAPRLGVRRRSRFVAAAISIAGASALGAWWATGAAAAVPITLVGFVATAAAVSDIHTSRIPNGLIVLALVVLAGSWVFVSLIDNRSMPPLLASLAAGLGLSGAPAMFVIWLVAPQVLGGGDWKLLSVLGLATGYVAPLVATVIVIGALAGGIAVAAIVRRRTIILGPPLALGYVAAIAAVVAWPDTFGNWYG